MSSPLVPITRNGPAAPGRSSAATKRGRSAVSVTVSANVVSPAATHAAGGVADAAAAAAVLVGVGAVRAAAASAMTAPVLIVIVPATWSVKPPTARTRMAARSVRLSRARPPTVATIGTVVTVFGATVLTSVRAVPSSSEQYGTAGWDPSVRVREPTNSPSDQFDPLPVHDVVVAPDGSRSSTVAGAEPR